MYQYLEIYYFKVNTINALLLANVWTQTLETAAIKLPKLLVLVAPSCLLCSQHLGFVSFISMTKPVPIKFLKQYCLKLLLECHKKGHKTDDSAVCMGISNPFPTLVSMVQTSIVIVLSVCCPILGLASHCQLKIWLVTYTYGQFATFSIQNGEITFHSARALSHSISPAAVN